MVNLPCAGCGSAVSVDITEYEGSMTIEDPGKVLSCKSCLKPYSSYFSKTKIKKIFGKKCHCGSGKKRKNCCRFKGEVG